MIVRHALRWTVSVTAFGVLATAATTAVAEDAYSIKRAYRAGDMDKYKVTLALEIDSPQGPLKLSGSMRLAEKTKSVKEDGTVVVEWIADVGTINFNGTEQPMPGLPDSTVLTIDKSGKVSKQEGGNPNGPLQMLVNVFRSQTPPENKVKVGEEYKFEVPFGDDKEKKVKGSASVVAFEPKSAAIPVDVLRLKGSAEVPSTTPGVTAPNHVEATYLIEPGTGKAVRVEGKTNFKLPNGNSDGKLTFTVARVFEGSK